MGVNWICLYNCKWKHKSYKAQYGGQRVGRMFDLYYGAFLAIKVHDFVLDLVQNKLYYFYAVMTFIPWFSH